jgi:hypothetical protein
MYSVTDENIQPAKPGRTITPSTYSVELQPDSNSLKEFTNFNIDLADMIREARNVTPITMEQLEQSRSLSKVQSTK